LETHKKPPLPLLTTARNKTVNDSRILKKTQKSTISVYQKYKTQYEKNPKKINQELMFFFYTIFIDKN